MNARTIWLRDHVLPILGERVEIARMACEQADKALTEAQEADREARNTAHAAVSALDAMRKLLHVYGVPWADSEAAAARGYSPPECPPLCGCEEKGGAT